MNTTPTHLNPKAIRILKVPIRKHQVKLFCAGSGAFLMIIDAGLAVIAFFFHVHVMAAIETFIATGGKTGAALAGLTFIFEKVTHDERDIPPIPE